MISILLVALLFALMVVVVISGHEVRFQRSPRVGK